MLKNLVTGLLKGELKRKYGSKTFYFTILSLISAIYAIVMLLAMILVPGIKSSIFVQISTPIAVYIVIKVVKFLKKQGILSEIQI